MSLAGKGRGGGGTDSLHLFQNKSLLRKIHWIHLIKLWFLHAWLLYSSFCSCCLEWKNEWKERQKEGCWLTEHWAVKPYPWQLCCFVGKRTGGYEFQAHNMNYFPLVTVQWLIRHNCRRKRKITIGTHDTLNQVSSSWLAWVHSEANKLAITSGWSCVHKQGSLKNVMTTFEIIV